MSRSNRLLVTALAWLILCGAGDPKQEVQAKGPPIVAPASSQPSFAAFPDPQSDACYNVKDHDRADLCAQWRAALAAEKSAHEARRATNWAIFSTIASVLGLFFIVYSLRQTSKSLEAAHESNRIARSSLRPWLDFEVVGDIQFQRNFRLNDDESENIAVISEIILKNYGESPAINIRVGYKIVEGSFNISDIIDKMKINSNKGLLYPPAYKGLTDIKLPQIWYNESINLCNGLHSCHLFIMISYETNDNVKCFTCKIFSLVSEKHSCQYLLFEARPFLGGGCDVAQ